MLLPMSFANCWWLGKSHVGVSESTSNQLKGIKNRLMRHEVFVVLVFVWLLLKRFRLVIFHRLLSMRVTSSFLVCSGVRERKVSMLGTFLKYMHSSRSNPLVRKKIVPRSMTKT